MNQTNLVSHILPCPVVFISTAHGENRDIMTATAMFISEKEPLLAVSVAKNHLTDQLIEQSGEFTLAIASESQQKLALQLGSVNGDKVDKFERFSFDTHTYKLGKPPIPEGATAWVECKVESHQELDGYYLVTARVVDQKDLGNPPLIWQKDAMFALKPL